MQGAFTVLRKIRPFFLKQLVRDLLEQGQFAFIINAIDWLLVAILLIEMNCSPAGKFFEDELAFFSELCISKLLLDLKFFQSFVDAPVQVHALKNVGQNRDFLFIQEF